MGDGTSDEEIVAAFRAWIELPADATPEQMWAARPSRVAVHRRLRAEPDPVDFIEILLRSATDDQSLAVICDVIADLLRDGRATRASGTVFNRSADEPWATLSRHVFPSGAFEGVLRPQINLAHAIEAYTWMGGELEPGETHGDRYSFVAMDRVESALANRAVDPIPLLQRLRRSAHDEFEEDHVLTGPFESVCFARPELRERVAAIAPSPWRDHLRNL